MKSRFIRPFTYAMSFSCLIFTSTVFAGLLAESTRMIYPEGKKEVAVMLNNTNDYAVLAQVWVDQGQGTPDHAVPEMLVLPPLFRLQPHETRGIRIILSESTTLPTDRESLFWLNLFEVPQIQAKKQREDHLIISMNTQLKLLYRPKVVPPPNLTHSQQPLSFHPVISTSSNNHTLRIQNHSPSYFSFDHLQLHTAKGTLALATTQLTLAPYQGQSFEFTTTAHDTLSLSYDLIDDQGHYHRFVHAF